MAKISTLTDDFQDGSIDPSKWIPTGSVVETGGRAVLTPTSAYSFLASNLTNYDLTSSSITAQIPVVPPTGVTGIDSAMVLDFGDNSLSIRKAGSELRCSQQISGVTTNLSFTPYNATNHLYWRIRETGGNVYWETSATGSGVFFIQYTVTTASLFPLTNLGCAFYTGFPGFESSPGTFAIEAINPGLQITASGASTSSGTLALRRVLGLTGSATSTSSGSISLSIPPLTAHALTASGSSTTTGTASFIILSPGQLTANALSVSQGDLRFIGVQYITATAQSYSTAQLTFTVVSPNLITQYFYFEPPIAYDLPPTLPGAGIINSYARWKGGQRRGRSVLKLNGTYTTIDTPTIDQINAATEVYQGGHIYTITNIQADALVSAGYAVIPIPVNFTLYPGEDIYPEDSLFPAYQELLPV